MDQAASSMTVVEVEEVAVVAAEEEDAVVAEVEVDEVGIIEH